MTTARLPERWSEHAKAAGGVKATANPRNCAVLRGVLSGPRSMIERNRHLRRLMRRFEPSPEARITGALGKLFAAIEAGEVSAETAAAALRRHGENLAKAGGMEAMRAAAEAVCAARPERAGERQAMVTAAWAGIDEWSTE